MLAECCISRKCCSGRNAVKSTTVGKRLPVSCFVWQTLNSPNNENSSSRVHSFSDTLYYPIGDVYLFTVLPHLVFFLYNRDLGLLVTELDLITVLDFDSSLENIWSYIIWL
jgi:hypothetical protein